jgi:hypothetical protein
VFFGIVWALNGVIQGRNQMGVPKPVFLVKKFATAILIILATFTTADVALATEGPTLTPTEYKPLPVGTKVNYDTWGHTVKRSDGFKTGFQTSKTNNWFTTVFSYVAAAPQGGVGLHFDYTKNTSLGLGYRFFSSSDAKFDYGTDKVEAEYSSHIISVGLVHRF